MTNLDRYIIVPDDSFKEAIATISKITRKFWLTNSKEGISVPFDGIPVLSLGGKWFQCHQGQDIDRTEKEKRKEKKDHQQVISHFFSTYYATTSGIK